MARIPLVTAQRGLDTGPLVQYPDGSPIGDALVRAGGALQGVAFRVRQKQDEKDSFDAKLRENEMTQTLAGMEDQAVQNAPEDASGLHDSTYGQLDPSGRVAKPGNFDKVFDDYLARVPKSKQAEFAAKRESYRLAGSNRMAEAQYRGEQAYYKVSIQKTQDQIVNSMLAGDPNDIKTYDQFKQQGLDIIDKSGLPALEKDVARVNWEANASETLFKLKLAKDPGFAAKARGALGLAHREATGGDAVSTVVNKIIGVESGGNPNAKNPNSSASGTGQFIDSTWVNMIRQHRPDIAAGKSAAQIIALKNDPALGREMTEAYTRDNAQYLTNRGVRTSAGNLYLAHFLGPAGAVEVLKADPNTPIVNVVGGDVVKANPFLAGKTAADTAAWAAKKMGSAVSAPPDPAFANIPPDRRLVLANQADVQVNEQNRQALADQNAQYAAYKDALELQIVQGKVRDDAIISNDGVLTDGDKATLLRSVHAENKDNAGVDAILGALTGGGKAPINPFDSDQTRIGDKAYDSLISSAPADQRQAVGEAYVSGTGYVPKRMSADVQQSLSSTIPQTVGQGLEQASRLYQIAPSALSTGDGSKEIRDAAVAFNEWVYGRGLSRDEAGKRWADLHSPEAIEKQSRLKEPAKDFLKTLAITDVTNAFDTAFTLEPSGGLTPDQQSAVMSDYSKIAEKKFIEAGGDPNLAKQLALADMKKLYGVSSVSGSSTVMKFPPEKYYPPVDGKWDYIRQAAMDDAKGINADAQNVMLVPTKETADDIRAGQLPRYGILYQDQDGVWNEVSGQRFAVNKDEINIRLKADQERRVNEAQTLHQSAVETIQQEDAGQAAYDKALQETVGPDWMKANAASAAREKVISAPPPTKDKIQQGIAEERARLNEERRNLLGTVTQTYGGSQMGPAR